MTNIKTCHVMAKPTSFNCNLKCDYCFYLEKEALYQEQKLSCDKFMSDETLELYISQYIASYPENSEVEFTWQGGEPTLMGLDFFTKVVKLQKSRQGSKHIINSIQTNGILLNDKWCEFLKQNDFLVGISIDGPEEIHNKLRNNQSGKGSHQKVSEAINLLKKHAIRFNTLTVINSHNVDFPVEIYNYLKIIGSQYIQFIPIVERKSTTPTNEGLYLISPEHKLDSQVTEWSVSSRKYGEFLNAIFDIWVKTDVGRIFVNIFDATLAGWCDQIPGICVQAKTCGRAFVLESNGDIYNCDHFVYPEHNLGNIHHTSIEEIANLKSVEIFGKNKQQTLTKDCLHCPYKDVCNGGCPKHRFIVSDSGFSGHNYFCEGLFNFFNHSKEKMHKMRDLIFSKRSPAEVMLGNFEIKFNKSTIPPRNSLCTCGSNKKSKKCCYR